MSVDEKVRSAAAAIKAADALLVTAGAGMGVDSGLPDFRGAQGFWRAYPLIAKLGLSFEEMANPAWFKENPHLAWAFYGHRLNRYRSTDPHAGFNQLLEFGNSTRDGYFVFTSNVDGQFQKAGFSPERIVECHGSIHQDATRDAYIEDEASRREAYEQAIVAIKQNYPGAQKFESYDYSRITRYGSTYYVKIQVDGLNAFGGPVRNVFDVEMHHDGNVWNCARTERE